MTATRTYRVTILHYPSGRWLEDINFTKRPDRAKDIDTLPRLQVPGSYEIAVCTVDNSRSGGELGARIYGYLKHVDGTWHAGQPDPWPRRCFYIPAEPYNENGWVPSLVIEGQPHHTPLAGDGKLIRPWYLGTSYEQARQVCERENEKTFGLSPEQALAIVWSSINAAGARS